MSIKIKPVADKPLKIKLKSGQNKSSTNSSVNKPVIRMKMSYDELSDEELIEKFNNGVKDVELEDLYTNHKYDLNRYVRAKYYGKIKEKIVVCEYEKLQEFYIPKFLMKMIQNDDVLSYAIKYSEFIKEGLDDEELNRKLENSVGCLIFLDLPEESYEFIFGNCEFESLELV